MMNVRKSACLAVLLGGLIAPAFGAASFNMSVRSDGIQFGKYVMGPKLTAADLKGKVVLVEFWGIN
jgi:hypothetical protein